MPRQIFILAVAAAIACAVIVARFLILAPREAAVVRTLVVPPLRSSIAPGASTTPAMDGSSAPMYPLPGKDSGETIAELERSSAVLRASLVNIVCIAPGNSSFHSISATGVIVSPEGYVLTNAHVASYFLLADQGVECTLRSGDPAHPAYWAGLAYLPPAWISEHAGVFIASAPSGTGEEDFAILVITKTADGTPIRTPLPFITLAPDVPATGAQTVVATYGAQGLSMQEIVSSLRQTVVASAVLAHFTYGTSSIDALSLAGSVAAQEGSSGGGVADLSGHLAGVITTSKIAGAYANRSLLALAVPYIKREYASQTGSTLETLLATPPRQAIEGFAPHMRPLEQQILSASGY